MILLSAFSKFGQICSDHTIEILVMLLGTALLTWLLRGLFADKSTHTTTVTEVDNSRYLTLQTDNDDLRTRLADLERQRTHLTHQLSIAQTQGTASEDYKIDIAAERDEWQGQLNTMRTDLAAWKDKYNALVEEHTGVDGKLHAKDLQLVEWQAKYADLQAAQADADAKFKKAQAEFDSRLQTAQTDFDNQLKVVTDEAADLRQKLATIDTDWKSKFVKIEKEKVDATLALNAKQQEADIWRTRLAEAEKAQQDWSGKVAALENEKNALAADVATKDQEITDWRTRLQDAEKAHADWSLRITALETEKNNLAANFAKQQAETEAWRHRLQEAEQAQSDWTLRISTLETEKNGLLASVTTLQQGGSEWENKYQTLYQDYDALEDKYTNLVQQAEGWHQRFSILDKNYNALEDRHNDLIQEAQGWQHRFNLLDKDHDALQDRYHALIQEHNGWEMRYQLLNNKVAALEQSAQRAQMYNFAGKAYYHDDLKIVEGIGPKIEQILHGAGIKTWKQLSETPTDRLREILGGAGERYRLHDPSTWAQQAALAAAKDWDALGTLQDELNAGKQSSTEAKERVSYKERLRELERGMKGYTLVDKDRLAALEREALADGARVFGRKLKKDDLTLVEGIGEVIAELLIAADIKTWYQLSETTPERLREILDAAGNNFAMHDPATWPEQAELADRGRWERLKKLQDELIGGRAPEGNS